MRKQHRDEQLLVPATRAAWKLAISRQSLRRLIKAGVIHAVRIGSRPYVPHAEIERIVSGATKPAMASQLAVGGSPPAQSATDGSLTGQGWTNSTLTPTERMAAILAEVADASD